MPFDSNEKLPKGVKGLPEAQQTKWRKVFNAAYDGTCKDKGKDRDSCASKIAWSQIEDKYKGKALVEFSLMIQSATHDKKAGTLRWKAVASDTDEDFYHDNMSLELFNDFINRIEIIELAPEEFRSTYWQGGMPYLSVSHYTDLEGKAVPGPVERIFVDGVQLKADGQFYKTPLGLSCYYALCKDLYEEPKPDNPIRISIAFLDYGHVHKSNSYEFIRESLNDVCPECIKESITGESDGKIFKKGLLVHLALTRVPANERTSMEVERAMTTRKEDAESIIGEELAAEIDESAKLVGKSQALVIKSEEEAVETSTEMVEEAKKPDDEETNDDEKCPDGMSEEDCKKQKEQMNKSLSEPVPVVVVDDYVEYKPYGGATSMKAAVAYVEAQKEQWRISDLWWAFQNVMSNIQSDETLDDKAQAISSAASELKDMIGDKSIEMFALLSQKSEVEPKQVVAKAHDLDTVFDQFKLAYDEVKSEPITAEEKLQKLQDHFQVVGQEIQNHIKSSTPVEEVVVSDAGVSVETLSLAIAQAMKPMQDTLNMILTQQKEMVKSPTDKATPVRRSIVPNLTMQEDIKSKPVVSKKQSTTPKLRAIIEQGLRQ